MSHGFARHVCVSVFPSIPKPRVHSMNQFWLCNKVAMPKQLGSVRTSVIGELRASAWVMKNSNDNNSNNMVTAALNVFF